MASIGQSRSRSRWIDRADAQACHKKPDDFQVNSQINPIVVNTVIEMVHDITNQVKEGKITLYKAVVRAHDIEHSLLEKELPNLIVSESPEFLDA